MVTIRDHAIQRARQRWGLTGDDAEVFEQIQDLFHTSQRCGMDGGAVVYALGDKRLRAIHKRDVIEIVTVFTYGASDAHDRFNPRFIQRRG